MAPRETREPIMIVLNVNLISEESSNSMVQFVMSEYWTFTEAACSLAKTIQRVKFVRGDFLLYADCLIQAKTLMFEEAMKETEELITAGKLRQYSIESKPGVNNMVHYTTRRFGQEGVSSLYGVPELLVIHNTMR